VEYARANAERAGLAPRVKAVAANADDARGVARRAPTRVDALLLDPPRTGAPGVAQLARALRPRRVVYVSCHPATLARDLSALTKVGFALTRVQAVDLFPRTWHVEAVAVLEASGAAA
jgi:23S rRNA (uracil1939-C5)-methyltransferase